MSTEVGAFVKARRLELLMSITELADNSGVSQNTISAIERGYTQPNARTCRKLSDALGITIEAPKRKARGRQGPVTDAFLREYYLKRRWSIRRIANAIQCSYGTTRRYLLAAGIELRTPGRPRGKE